MTAELHTLTGAYALDAVPEAEAAAFERHLTGCPACRQEVRELRETAARLGAAVAATPPPELRDATLSRAAKTRQWPPLVRRISPVKPLSVRIGLLAAAAAAVLAVVFGVSTLDTEQRPDPGQEQVAAVNAVLAAPDATTTRNEGASVVTSVSQGKIVVLAGGLPPLAAGRVYQAWLIGAGEVRSAGLLEPDGPHRTRPVLADLPPGTDRVGITAEPTGGSPAPTTPEVAMILLRN